MTEKFRVPIAISGYGGSGKTEVGKLVAKKLGFQFLSGGHYIRALGKELGKSTDNGEFQKYREDFPEIDYKLDFKQFYDLCKGSIVLESRFGALYHPCRSTTVLHGFHEKIGVNRKHVMVPGKVFTIFLSCGEEVRHQRLYKRAQDNWKEGDPAVTFDLVKANEIKRHQSDLRLYEKRYQGLNPFDDFYSEYLIGSDIGTVDAIAETVVKKYHIHVKELGF